MIDVVAHLGQVFFQSVSVDSLVPIIGFDQIRESSCKPL
jgi:hypothetical protein